MANKKAFTLIELLVVIAIIALLLSIMVPALNRARLLARQLLCMANMRSLTNSSMMYTSDNDGSLPMCGSRNAAGNLFGQYPYAPFWDVRLLPYLGIENVNLEYDPQGEDRLSLANYDKLKPHKKALEAFLCPAERATQKNIIRSTYSANQFPESYVINGHVSGLVTDRLGGEKRDASYRKNSSKVSRISQTSRTLLFADTKMNWVSWFNGRGNWCVRYWWDLQPAHFVKIINPDTSWNGWGAPEASGRSDFAFVDGHVESLKIQFTRAGYVGVMVGDPTPDAIPGIKFSHRYKW